jgi:hypothetical protein
MQLTYVAVVILASMVFVLSGMVGYLYWQQTRMLQHLQSLAGVISTHLVRRPEPQPEAEAEVEAEAEAEPETEQEQDDMPLLVSIKEVAEDDRLSVEKVDGPPATAPTAVKTDDLDKKTSAELRELLTSRGIPFGKRDAKSVLLQLLKATA